MEKCIALKDYHSLAKLSRNGALYPTTFIKGEYYIYCESDKEHMLVFMGDDKGKLSIQNILVTELTKEKFDFYFMNAKEYFYKNEKGVVK